MDHCPMVLILEQLWSVACYVEMKEKWESSLSFIPQNSAENLRGVSKQVSFD